ncbi:hypothetical protein [Streptomyces sp. H34-S4]|uniref:hypothetical protein n=1 Tax=Streptomyces sp. H34-S4 TaxID=2996463 RepID=UPI00227070F3|nr:hypothetical protein [Streptomyces sp. H34-S4]MCY0937468.1 hypothetical protein [Streptomyces sp. H34-S4]
MRAETISVAQRLVVWSVIGLSSHLLSKVSCTAKGGRAIAVRADVTRGDDARWITGDVILASGGMR